MRIHLFDPSGCGLGLAIGLVQLGHTVVHRGPSAWNEAIGETNRLCRELAQHWCGTAAVNAADAADCDLLVIVDVFADLLHALVHGIGALAPFDPTRPFADTRNPTVYPERLRFWSELTARVPRVVVVDMSDASAFREVGFEALPHATLLARECAGRGHDRWQPFPFLYNNVMLWVELMRPECEWWFPTSRRRRKWDWVFCGTIEHRRYEGRRQAALERVGQQWPCLRGHVVTQVPFVEVLGILQSARFGLDLPGAGEVCFRVHECLALGTPVLRPEPGRVCLAAGLASVVVGDPSELQGLDAEAVRSVYRASYAPRAAATAMLAAVAADDARLAVPAS